MDLRLLCVEGNKMFLDGVTKDSKKEYYLIQ